jgi:hypothetical protein
MPRDVSIAHGHDLQHALERFSCFEPLALLRNCAFMIEANLALVSSFLRLSVSHPPWPLPLWSTPLTEYPRRDRELAHSISPIGRFNFVL